MPSKKPSAKPKLSKNAQYLLLFGLLLSVVLFALTQHPVLALVALAFLAGVLYVEFQYTQNWKELAASAGIALSAWLLLSFLLNTASPINIITSCSMLPGYERGDLIFLYGGKPDAPNVSVPFALDETQYAPAEIQLQGQTVARVLQPHVNGQPLFEPVISTCQRQSADGNRTTVCLSGVTLQGQKISVLESSSISVFDSNTSAGLIVHRLFAVLEATDGTYYLTKGDNNPFLDQQSGFKLIPAKTADRVLLNLPLLGILSWKNGFVWQSESQVPVKGNVLFKIPYIGYVKLLLFLQIETPAGCDSFLHPPA
ncbi:hypothetical protein HY572_00840 [Candidatus Micrarchaeota archaeon]|nr:hypothetical protein [Candidatus Micrarchaeota archaeon]